MPQRSTSLLFEHVTVEGPLLCFAALLSLRRFAAMLTWRGLHCAELAAVVCDKTLLRSDACMHSKYSTAAWSCRCPAGFETSTVLLWTSQSCAKLPQVKNMGSDCHVHRWSYFDHQVANPGKPQIDTHPLLQHALCAFLTHCLHCLAVS